MLKFYHFPTMMVLPCRGFTCADNNWLPSVHMGIFQPLPQDCTGVDNLNYYLSFDVCAGFRPSVRKKKLFNGCTYQKMLVYKVVPFLKRIKMAILFLIFLDQIRPKWIKLANLVNRHLEFKPKGLDF